LIAFIVLTAIGGSSPARAETAAECVWSKLSPEKKTTLSAEDGITPRQASELTPYIKQCGGDRIPTKIMGALVGAQIERFIATSKLKGSPITQDDLEKAWVEAPQSARDCAMAASATAFGKPAPYCPGPQASFWFLHRLNVPPSDNNMIEGVLRFMGAKAVEEWAK
jgi:hypothetical protein